MFSIKSTEQMSLIKYKCHYEFRVQYFLFCFFGVLLFLLLQQQNLCLKVKSFTFTIRNDGIHRSEWPTLKSLQIINMGEHVEKMEPSYTGGGHLNWYRPYGKQYGGSSKIINKSRVAM